VSSANDVTYWGTASGTPPPESHRPGLRWTAEQIHGDYDAALRSWPREVRLRVPGLGEVLFCHATPRSETECFTRLTPERLLRPLFEGLDVSTVICGHTHMQFDRWIADVRVVNAGSVGMPFGHPGAYWVMLGPGVELRRTPYDLSAAAKRIRSTTYPHAEQFAAQNVLEPPTEDSMLAALSSVSFR
jgi:predicted phosphodiesterase